MAKTKPTRKGRANGKRTSKRSSKPETGKEGGACPPRSQGQTDTQPDEASSAAPRRLGVAFRWFPFFTSDQNTALEFLQRMKVAEVSERIKSFEAGIVDGVLFTDFDENELRRRLRDTICNVVRVTNQVGLDAFEKVLAHRATGSTQDEQAQAREQLNEWKPIQKEAALQWYDLAAPPASTSDGSSVRRDDDHHGIEDAVEWSIAEPLSRFTAVRIRGSPQRFDGHADASFLDPARKQLAEPQVVPASLEDDDLTEGSCRAEIEPGEPFAGIVADGPAVTIEKRADKRSGLRIADEELRAYYDDSPLAINAHTDFTMLPPQQNSWVSTGSGSRPRAW